MLIINGVKRTKLTKDDINYLYLATYPDNKNTERNSQAMGDAHRHADDLTDYILRVNNDPDELASLDVLIRDQVETNQNSLRDAVDNINIKYNEEDLKMVARTWNAVADVVEEARYRDIVFRITRSNLFEYAKFETNYSV